MRSLNHKTHFGIDNGIAVSSVSAVCVIGERATLVSNIESDVTCQNCKIWLAHYKAMLRTMPSKGSK